MNYGPRLRQQQSHTKLTEVDNSFGRRRFSTVISYDVKDLYHALKAGD